MYSILSCLYFIVAFIANIFTKDFNIFIGYMILGSIFIITELLNNIVKDLDDLNISLRVTNTMLIANKLNDKESSEIDKND